MKKLLAGLRDFHDNVRPAHRELYAKLALGQSPDCLFVSCSDSRVAPNLFASTNPGDLFVLRNVGNVVPPCGAVGDESAGAAVEFATLVLEVQDIIVCGHSSCGAMGAALAGAPPAGAPNLEAWLDFVSPSLGRLHDGNDPAGALSDADRLSRAHVLQQIENLRTYPSVADRLADGRIALHGWWFDIANAEVLAFDAASSSYVPIVGQAR